MTEIFLIQFLVIYGNDQLCNIVLYVDLFCCLQTHVDKFSPDEDCMLDVNSSNNKSKVLGNL